jgi:hypothetical protein
MILAGSQRKGRPMDGQIENETYSEEEIQFFLRAFLRELLKEQTHE